MFFEPPIVSFIFNTLPYILPVYDLLEAKFRVSPVWHSCPQTPFSLKIHNCASSVCGGRGETFTIHVLFQVDPRGFSSV